MWNSRNSRHDTFPLEGLATEVRTASRGAAFNNQLEILNFQHSIN